MRTIALAAIFGVGLLAGGVAAADPYNDPAGRFTVNTPAGWRIQPRNATGQSVVLAFNATNDCYFFGVPNPATANSSPEAVHNTQTPLTPEAWATAGTPVRDFFDGAAPTVVSQSVDTSGFWPVQRAELRGPSKTAYAAILTRPGLEIRAFCSGASSASAYDSIFASLGHPNDAAWQQAAQEAGAARAAREAAAPPAAAQGQATTEEAQPEERRQRRNRDPSRRD
ncbi:hypothetical protein [Candidatus Viadribacter manganicus]|uniref:Uncharacterized protein n=1 Tax=Candidatus Viadribacter manganicus TaxID=1759059 RepID=A0A1B1AEL8_9PROT|nr:hypothetical protein [Candidatus Viadribacter manganicus]ANP44992.1 hypothetical protein ATE48_03170 [Candidatus Viadribacter manganicus]